MPHHGSIGPSDLPEMLVSLRASSSTGRLRVEREGVARDLYLRGGRVIGADSSAGTDSLEWLLFTAGVLSEEGHGRVRSQIAGGSRPGRALVEWGGISAASLCEWTGRRARFLALDVLRWRSGTYEFEEGAEPPAGAIPVDLDPVEVLLAALRDGSSAPLLAGRLPSADAVLELAPAAGLDERHRASHEAYVLSLADGRRKVAEICFLSEIGEAETLSILALMSLVGWVRPASPGPEGAQPAPPQAGGGVPEAITFDLPAGDSTAELRAAIRIYNELFGLVYAHMIKEVGPIAEQLLEKNLKDVRGVHASLFQRLSCGRDGVLPEDALMRNVNLIRDGNRRDLLVAGLHDHLQAMLLAVRRILGPEHETRVLRRIKELRCSRT